MKLKKAKIIHSTIETNGVRARIIISSVLGDFYGTVGSLRGPNNFCKKPFPGEKKGWKNRKRQKKKKGLSHFSPS